MPEFRITYMDVIPHPRVRGLGRDNKRVLVVEAKTKVDAYCVAYDELCRRGYYVGYFSATGYGSQDILVAEEWTEVVARGVPKESAYCAGAGSVSITKIEPHAVRKEGKVLAEETENAAR